MFYRVRLCLRIQKQIYVLLFFDTFSSKYFDLRPLAEEQSTYSITRKLMKRKYLSTDKIKFLSSLSHNRKRNIPLAKVHISLATQTPQTSHRDP